MDEDLVDMSRSESIGEDRSHPRTINIYLWRVVVKSLLLFALCNLAFFALHPLPALGKLSLYNRVFPGRSRLPYGDNPSRAYNLSLFNVPAMFASHQISGEPKSPGEFRVIMIGDSATWGFLLQAHDTVAARLDQLGLSLPDGRRVRVYNLGYPVMSLTKDLLLLREAMRYQPDLIVWAVTLESFPRDKQFFPPLLQNNPDLVRALIDDYDLDLDPRSPELIDPKPWQQTILGQRRALADLLRLQLYGVLWAGTGIDTEIPASTATRMEDLPPEIDFHELQPPILRREDLAFDALRAGKDLAAGVPLLVVNEPMFISQGENSDLRYNFFYSRWAYDGYRQLLAAESQAHGWRYTDLWDALPPAEFTNTAIHFTPAGAEQYARLLAAEILEIATSRR